MASSKRPSYNRGNSFHSQPSPRAESIAMAKQVYLANQTALAQVDFVDIGMRKSRSLRKVVSASVGACKANIVQEGPNVALPEMTSLLPMSEKASKIPPPRPARAAGEFGVPDEPVRQKPQESDQAMTPESWARDRTSPSEPEYREDGFF